MRILIAKKCCWHWGGTAATPEAQNVFTDNEDVCPGARSAPSPGFIRVSPWWDTAPV